MSLAPGDVARDSTRLDEVIAWWDRSINGQLYWTRTGAEESIDFSFMSCIKRATRHPDSAKEKLKEHLESDDIFVVAVCSELLLFQRGAAAIYMHR